MLVLREVLTHAVGLGRRCPRQVTDRERADLRSRRVSFLERRRHAEHVGDVVEAVRGIVRRQERRRIDVERQQIADGVRVLERFIRRSMGRLDRDVPPRAIEHRRQRVDQRAIGRLVGPSRTRRRSMTRVCSLRTTFSRSQRSRQPSRIECVERQIAAREAGVVAANAILIDGRASGQRIHSPPDAAAQRSGDSRPAGPPTPATRRQERRGRASLDDELSDRPRVVAAHVLAMRQLATVTDAGTTWRDAAGGPRTVARLDGVYLRVRKRDRGPALTQALAGETAQGFDQASSRFAFRMLLTVSVPKRSSLRPRSGRPSHRRQAAAAVACAEPCLGLNAHTW